MPRLGNYKALSPDVPAHVASLLIFLRQMLVEAGVSVAALGRRLHRDTSRISRVINGEVPVDEKFVHEVISLWTERVSADDERAELVRTEGRGLWDRYRRQDAGDSGYNEAAISPTEPARPRPIQVMSKLLRSWRQRLRTTLVVAAILISGTAGDMISLSAPVASSSASLRTTGIPTQLGDGIKLARLVLYWHPNRHDNLVTTEDRQAENFHRDALGYRAAGLDSYIVADAPASKAWCLVPLVRYVGEQPDGDPDHATTTDPAWLAGHAPPGFQMQATVGYVYRPDLPRPPASRPLFRLFSPSRGYFTTSQEEWAGAPGDVKKRGYLVERVEGFVLLGPRPAPCSGN